MVRPLILILLATTAVGCAKKVETAAAPVATLSATHEDVAVKLHAPPLTKGFPAVLMAVDLQVPEIVLAGPLARDGQVRLVTDADTESILPGSPDTLTDQVGAPAFDADGLADAGSWAIGCARFRAEDIAVAGQQTEQGTIYPIAEVVPGTLQTLDDQVRRPIARARRTPTA